MNLRLIVGAIVCWWQDEHVKVHDRRYWHGKTLIFTHCERCNWSPRVNPVELERVGPECLYCKCTNDRACDMPRGEGPCWWVSSNPPICSHDECQAHGRRDGYLPPIEPSLRA